jgi:hypothetical protein
VTATTRGIGPDEATPGQPWKASTTLTNIRAATPAAIMERPLPSTPGIPRNVGMTQLSTRGFIGLSIFVIVVTVFHQK